MEGSRRRGLFCDSRISLEDADLLKEGCAGQTTSHRLRWASYGPVGPLSYTMYYVHMCITHITCASRWSSIHLASPSHSSTSPIASQLVFSRSLVFFGLPHLYRRFRRRCFPPPTPPSSSVPRHRRLGIEPPSRPQRTTSPSTTNPPSASPPDRSPPSLPFRAPTPPPSLDHASSLLFASLDHDLHR